MKRITIYDLPQETRKKLEKYAEEHGLSISSAIKSILAEFLK